MLPGIELSACQGMAVPVEVMHHVVRVESSFNPYAIGVVGGRLVRQPKTLPEALSTVRMLESRGYNFSLGLAQVNRYNLDKYGLDSYEKAFEPCANLIAGSKILAECYGRSGGDWGKSFSCYYSGNFSTGFRHGYVQKIYASIRQGRQVEPESTVQPIEVVSRAARRTVPVSRHPLYATASAETGSMPIASVQTQQPMAPSRVQSVPGRRETVNQLAAVASRSDAAAVFEAPLAEAPRQIQVAAASVQPTAQAPNSSLPPEIVQLQPTRNQPVLLQPTQAAAAKPEAAPQARRSARPVDQGPVAEDSAFVF